jgi:hypothetical protein
MGHREKLISPINPLDRRWLRFRLVAGWLKQLDRIARGVVDKDLLASNSGNDFVAKSGARGTQAFDLVFNVRDF